MTVVNAWQGAVTPTTATVRTKVVGASVRLAVADNSGMVGPAFFGPVVPTADDIATVVATGLNSDQRYWWQIEIDSVVDTEVTGTFRTFPLDGSPASFTFAAAACAGGAAEQDAVGDVLVPSRISNHPVFGTISDLDLLFFAHMGDRGYYDLGSGLFGIPEGLPGASVDNYRRLYDDNLLQPSQQDMHLTLPVMYAWDDHDYGPNNSDGTFVGKANAQQVFRERVAHYPLTSSSSIFQSWQVGRILFAIADVRSERSPNSDPNGPTKTMLGSEQKTWLDALLAASDAEFFIWFMPSQWIGRGAADTWDNYADERSELVQLFGDQGFLNRMCIVGGDMHDLAIDTGTNSAGNIPVFQFASLDSDFGVPKSGYDTGLTKPGRNQYGTMTIADTGSVIGITGEAWTGTTPFRGHTVSIVFPVPPIVLPDSSKVITGSHGVVFDVRVLEDFQTGDDPQGTTIAFGDELTELGLNVGEVEFDATRTIRGTAFVRVPGTFGTDGESSFPRGKNRLLAPFGNEVFIRYGIDLGESILWTNMGYFRITDTHQDDAPNSPVELFCHDRTATIEDSELIDPRSYSPPQTVGDVFDDLIRDVYPEAVIQFDDATGDIPLASQIVAEKNRWKPLVEMADSFGKILYWDGLGILRIETPPNPDDITWELRSNRDGVLVEAKRELSREGIFNAVVVEGEKTGDVAPVRAVAINDDPNSPTRFGGRIGKVPMFLNTPLVSTVPQAENAARFLLQRALGAPYTVSTDSIINPAIRPYDAIRITYTNNNKDVHLVDRVRIPLDEDAGMAIDTREKALIVIGFE